MKAVIADPALHSMGGHHFSAMLRLRAELSALGVDHACLVSTAADARVTADLGCTPCFTRSVYGRGYQDRREFADSVRQTHRELSRALRGAAPPDLLILPCCDQVLALAVARYFRWTWFRRPPRIVLWLLFGPHYRKATDDPALAPLDAECRKAFAALRATVGDEGIMAYCETAGMADFYRAMTGLRIDVAPGPGLIGERVPVGATGQASRRAGGPTVTCIGFANEAKGYRFLPGAIERVLASDREVRFRIHGAFHGSDARDQAPTFEQLAALGPRVTVRTDVLSQPDYLAWLHEADLLLLPYDPEVYKTRGSGVFAEATRMGIPVIATKGCGFAQAAFSAGWGAEVASRDDSGIAHAALRALARLDDMTARARSAATAARLGDDAGTILRSAVLGSATPSLS
jgi:glycosyltransferase involved in cell wall biosynthesis